MKQTRPKHHVSAALVDWLEPRGRVRRLAADMGTSHVAVLKWRRSGVPAERVLSVWAATGLTPYQLRADLYPDPSWTPPNSPAVYLLREAA